MQRAVTPNPVANVSSAPLLAVHAQLLLVAVIWGATNPAMKHVYTWLEPFDVIFLRVGGASILYALLMVRRGREGLPRSWRDARGILILGFFGITLMNIAFTEGQQRIPVSLGSLVVTTNPVWTALIATAVGQERLTRRSVGGIGLATLGFVVVLTQGSGHGAHFGGAQLTGALIIALAPFSWAFYTVFSKPYLQRYDPIQFASWTAIVGVLCATPLLLIDHQIPHRISAMPSEGWPYVLFLALGGYFLSYILWYRGLRVLSASQTAVYIYLVPVFGMLFAWHFLGEAITPWFVVGAAIILAGVALTNSGRTAAPRATPKIAV